MGFVVVIWCLVGFFIFMKRTDKQERKYFMDDFNYANALEKMFLAFCMFCILLLYPVAIVCEILEGK